MCRLARYGVHEKFLRRRLNWIRVGLLEEKQSEPRGIHNLLFEFLGQPKGRAATAPLQFPVGGTGASRQAGARLLLWSRCKATWPAGLWKCEQETGRRAGASSRPRGKAACPTEASKGNASSRASKGGRCEEGGELQGRGGGGWNMGVRGRRTDGEGERCWRL